MDTTDTLVLGSGLAGLYFALHAAESGRVMIATKGAVDAGSSALAQGGVAVPVGSDDSVEQHVADTLRVGCGACREDIVWTTVAEGTRHLEHLVELGVDFARTSEGALELAREGGHGRRRVAHVEDMTGRAIVQALASRVAAHPNVVMLSNTTGVELVVDTVAGRATCVGAHVARVDSGRMDTIAARNVVLASGGLGQVYAQTSNPSVATGDGVAMAFRAGARVANMEFVQFHPTLLALPGARGFLISEALRGEGGELRLADGLAFMRGVHELGSLAPRDVVSRAIVNVLSGDAERCVYLDMTHMSPDELVSRFPAVHARCLALGLDLRNEWIPVSPGAHYACGGVDVDAWGQTSIGNLYAIGECAHTGLHGANRLASNSLLEALVFGARAARALREGAGTSSVATRLDPRIRQASLAPDVAAGLRARVRALMWQDVGILRSDAGLRRAAALIEGMTQEAAGLARGTDPTLQTLEVRNLLGVAEMIVASAAHRRESRGGHYNADHPDLVDVHADTLLDRGSITGATRKALAQHPRAHP